MVEIWGPDQGSGSPSESSPSSIGSGDRLRLESTDEEMNVCRPALPPPPKPVTPGTMSGESLDRFLETPNDGSTWMDGVLVFAAGWNVFGPRMGEERSSPYAARNGDGEEGRWRLSIVDGRGSAGGSLMRPTGWTRWASEGVTGVAADRSHTDSVSRDRKSVV